jgi:hypothetical protein
MKLVYRVFGVQLAIISDEPSYDRYANGDSCYPSLVSQHLTFYDSATWFVHMSAVTGIFAAANPISTLTCKLYASPNNIRTRSRVSGGSCCTSSVLSRRLAASSTGRISLRWERM